MYKNLISPATNQKPDLRNSGESLLSSPDKANAYQVLLCKQFQRLDMIHFMTCFSPL